MTLNPDWYDVVLLREGCPCSLGRVLDHVLDSLTVAGRLQVRLILTVLLLVFVVFLPIPLILCVVIRIIVLLLRSLLLLH